ncbi:TspO/MBR family protein [Mariniblastus fucicola]|uniref:TspO/MBR family protein n=1 Tax=Mariniblastus fucicola TaxID=980251 RepID=A0A5B9PJR2_9BACT|nr:TspO/MBR family protein [Mariniblastus fucicola]QEG24962.1 TspO/MBR family protein [Mariniblastus fucicola]
MSETNNHPHLLSSDGTVGDVGTPWSLKRDILSLIIWIAIVAVVMLLGGIATGSSVTTWYPTLNKPSFNPPSWLFGPVWSALYMMMAVAAWLIWRKRGDVADRDAKRWFLIAFGVQLVLNLGWSVIFFGLRSPMWAFVEICVLWIAIATTVVLSFRQNRTSGFLLLPYLAWSSFALILNLAIVRLNFN